jgi:hypothetical protein
MREHLAFVLDIVESPVNPEELSCLALPSFRERSGPAAQTLAAMKATTPASGTGSMKFPLNGTLDGANVEIREEVGAENVSSSASPPPRSRR